MEWVFRKDREPHLYIYLLEGEPDDDTDRCNDWLNKEGYGRKTSRIGTLYYLLLTYLFINKEIP